MVFILNHNLNMACSFLAELRALEQQKDRVRFRLNMQRLGEIFAYEISKTLRYEETVITTPFGEANERVLSHYPVLGTIIRAGLPLQEGLLRFFDRSDCVFFAAYRKTRKSGDFEIRTEYLSSMDLNDRTVIVSDAMIATGQSMVLACQEMTRQWHIEKLHIVTAIASEEGIEHIKAFFPNAYIWIGAMDAELTSKSYIVPGLGDAGDLAYGEKNH